MAFTAFGTASTPNSSLFTSLTSGLDGAASVNPSTTSTAIVATSAASTLASSLLPTAITTAGSNISTTVASIPTQIVTAPSTLSITIVTTRNGSTQTLVSTGYPPTDGWQPHSNTRAIGIGIGVSLGVLLIFIGVLIFYLKRYYLKRYRRNKPQRGDRDCSIYDYYKPRRGDHDCSNHDYYKPPKHGEAELATKEQQYSELPAKDETVYRGPMPPWAAELSAVKSAAGTIVRKG